MNSGNISENLGTHKPAKASRRSNECVLLLWGKGGGKRRDPDGEALTYEPTRVAAYALKKGKKIVKDNNF